MAEEFSPQGIQFIFMYVREAHPGDRYPHHTSFEQKLSHARDFAAACKVKRPILVDSLDGDLHRRYGGLPNTSFVIGRDGRIIYRADWTDPRTIRIAAEQLVYEVQSRRAGARLSPYRMEWLPQRENDNAVFLKKLLEIPGERAIDEFIAAIERSAGPGAGAALRKADPRNRG